MNSTPHILVVEDEPSILDTILYALTTEGMKATGSSTGEAALRHLATHTPNLIILDIGLPDTTGFDLCRKIRKTTTTPIIFLTARAGEIDRIIGLEIGADDYVVKPFSPRELAARVRAILRRTAPRPTSTTKTTCGLHHDPTRARITYQKRPLDLSSTEYHLLTTLYTHPGRVFSRAQLMDAAWPDPGTALERTVDAHIKSIRAKLKNISENESPIQTHRGLGYSLSE